MNWLSKVFFTVFCVLLLAGAASAATVDVGTGYPYTNIQDGINAATAGDTVRVHAGTYSISTMIAMKSGVSLVGDGVNKTVIKAASTTAGNTSTYPALIYCSGDSNLVISDMSVLGYYTDWSTGQHPNSGHNDYGIGINIRAASNNVTVHDIYIDMLTGDGLKVSGNTFTNLYNLKITTSGHDAVCFYSTSNGYLNNSYIDLAINTGIRYDGATNCYVANTTFIQSNAGTGAGYIELENVITNCTVTKCAFLTSTDPVVWFASSDSGTVNIYNNIIYGAPAMVSSLSPYTGTFTNNTRYTSSYDWGAMGYGYNAASTGSGSLPVYNGSVLPTLNYPSNNTTIHTINGKIAFDWSDVNSTQYRIHVANDANFTSIVFNQTVNTDGASLALSNGTYYWRLQAYRDSNSTWTANTSSKVFSIDGNDLAKAGAYGVIYDTSSDNPIKGAVVTLMNNSWSATAVTGEDGYYSFSVPANTGVYYISASATDFYSTISSAGQGLPLNMSGEYYEQNIALTKSPVYYNPHFVTFALSSPWGTTYEGVSTFVYTGRNSEIATYTGLTDAHGKITFKLDDDVEYRIFFNDSNQNINEERVLYPSDSTYTIWTYFGTKTNNTLATPTVDVSKAADYIGYGIADTELNISYGYINQTIISKDNQTLSYTTTITQIDAFGNVTGNFSYTTSGSNNSTSFATAVPVNATYRVTTTVNHPKYTQVYHNTITINPSGINPDLDFGWEDRWNYEAAGYLLVLLCAGLIGGRNLPMGIIGCICLGFLNLYIGWWQYDTGGMIMFYFAILLGFGYMLTKRG